MKPIRVLAHRTVDLHHRTVVNLSPGSRRCWFCREADPRAFKKVAHLVPQALGNKHLVTAEECDSCNTDYFANEIDDSFLKALQPYRLLHAARGQRGRLTLPKSSKSESRVKLAVPERRVVELTDSDADPMIEELDFESGEIVVTMDVPSHDPLAVPKALARMGILVSTELSVRPASRTNCSSATERTVRSPQANHPDWPRWGSRTAIEAP